VSSIDIELHIDAPPERCFDLSRSIELHAHSLGHTRETPVAGTVTGLIGMGESVTWRATHFGVRQRLTSRITAYDRPHHFRDSMVSGAFRRFDHDHFFDDNGRGGTIMRDLFDFDAPFGLIGRIAEGIFLTRYMRRLLAERSASIKRIAESDDWRQYFELHSHPGRR
jgi:ligand-binding SRPBCC domain-containing protein